MSKIFLNHYSDEKFKREILKMDPEEVYGKYEDNVEGVLVLYWMEELSKVKTGFLYRKDIINQGINEKWIDYYIKKDELVEPHKDMFYLNGLSPENIAYVQELIPEGVLSHQTALVIHNLCECFHDVVFITVPKGFDIDKAKKTVSHTIFFECEKNLMDLGKYETELSAGEKVFVYNKERTMCDIVRHRDRFDTEVFSKAIYWYFRNNNDHTKLWEYADIFGVKEKILHYWKKYGKEYGDY